MVDANPSQGYNLGDGYDEGIINGAKWIKKHYYDNGQNTLYSMIYGPKKYSSSKDKWIGDILYIMEKVIDFVQPKGKWKFNEEVAKCFDNMLERSIPDYQNMRKLEKLIINNSVSNKHTLLDIGCSNGINIDDFCNDMKCYGIDISEPMLQQARERFVKNNNVVIEQFNVLTG